MHDLHRLVTAVMVPLHSVFSTGSFMPSLTMTLNHRKNSSKSEVFSICSRSATNTVLQRLEYLQCELTCLSVPSTTKTAPETSPGPELYTPTYLTMTMSLHMTSSARVFPEKVTGKSNAAAVVMCPTSH